MLMMCLQEQAGLEDLRNQELLYASKDNVLIETLPTGMLGLPITPEPVYEILTESGQSKLLLCLFYLIIENIRIQQSEYFIPPCSY